MKIVKIIETEADRETDYAATILQQIRAADALALGAWGAHDIYLREHDRSVKFKVNGRVHKGWVLISLRNDLYNIEIAKDGAAQGFEWTVINSIEGAYDDMLVPVLDEWIEGRRGN